MGNKKRYKILIIQINNIDEEFWQWLNNKFLNNFKVNSSAFAYNSRPSYSNIDIYLNDASSILIGYPTIRQLRVKKSWEIFKTII